MTIILIGDFFFFFTPFSNKFLFLYAYSDIKCDKMKWLNE